MTMTSETSAGDGLQQGSPLPARRSIGLQECWLCGVQLPRASMVPDGGQGCPDIHWYCADVSSCTRRWTARRSSAGAAAAEPAASGSAAEHGAHHAARAEAS